MPETFPLYISIPKEDAVEFASVASLMDISCEQSGELGNSKVVSDLVHHVVAHVDEIAAAVKLLRAFFSRRTRAVSIIYFQTDVGWLTVTNPTNEEIEKMLSVADDFSIKDG